MLLVEILIAFREFFFLSLSGYKLNTLQPTDSFPRALIGHSKSRGTQSAGGKIMLIMLISSGCLAPLAYMVIPGSQYSNLLLINISVEL